MDKINSEEVALAAKNGVAAEGGKFLTFLLADEEYGLEILKVQEIIKLMNITPVPRTPEYVKGVINLRGKIIPVIDLRSKFGMESGQQTNETCVIVVEIRHGAGMLTMGVIVDMVSEVMDIESDMIAETPEFGVELDTHFILGIAKIEEKVIIILDADKVLTAREISIASSINKCPINKYPEDDSPEDDSPEDDS